MKAGPRRRTLLALGALVAAPAIVPFRAFAQTALPNTALRFLVGFAGGGGGELMARVIASRLEARTGRRVTIEHKPSSTGFPAGEQLMRDLRNGAVVAFMPSTTLAARLAGDVFPFDSESALVPLTVAGTFQVALAVASKPSLSTVAAYIKWMKTLPPGGVRLGLPAPDYYLKIYSMMLSRALDLDLETVPCAGAAPLIDAVKKGEIPAGLGSIAPMIQHNRDRAVTFLMTSGRRRVSILRDVPTALELGYPALELEEWYGFFGSSASPAPVLVKWNRQLRAVLAESEVVAALARLGLDVESSTQEEAAERFAAHLQAWKVRMESVDMKTVN